MKTAWILAATVVAVLTSAPSADAATYYVDFDHGSDLGAGTMASPWKHAPGDSEGVSGNADITLRPGDTVQFKGGVVYRGALDEARRHTGTPSARITYRGKGWGKGRAILDGSRRLAGSWTRCSSRADCAGNPHWEKIWRMAVPEGVDPYVGWYEQDEFIWPAQDPNPTDPFWYTDVTQYHQLAQSQVTSSSVTDSVRLTQPRSDAWRGADVLLWVSPNEVVQTPITGFNPLTRTLTFAPTSAPETMDNGKRVYSIINHLSLIDRPGEFALDTSANRLFVWPRAGSDPNALRYEFSERDNAIKFDYGSATDGWKTYEGFEIRKYGFPGYSSHDKGETGIVLRDNVITKNRATSRDYGWGALRMTYTRGALVEDNVIAENVNTAGLEITESSDVIVRGNTLRKNMLTGIRVFGDERTRIVDNAISENSYTHANGIANYGSNDSLIEGNVIFDHLRPLAMENSNNLTLRNNVFDTRGLTWDNKFIAEWGGMTGTITITNNVLGGSGEGGIYLANTDCRATYYWRNNIADDDPGEGCDNIHRSHNIYTRGSTSETGSFVVTDLCKLFAGVGARNFHHAAGSPAINAGTSLNAATEDMDGVPRPQGDGFDIGPYEFVEPATPSEGTPTAQAPDPSVAGSDQAGRLDPGAKVPSMSNRPPGAARRPAPAVRLRSRLRAIAGTGRLKLGLRSAAAGAVVVTARVRPGPARRSGSGRHRRRWVSLGSVTTTLVPAAERVVTFKVPRRTRRLLGRSRRARLVVRTYAGAACTVLTGTHDLRIER